MRQIGTLQNEADAQRFAAYLITQGISALAENDPDGWAIWVRDENHTEQARAELQKYQSEPAHQRYQGVERAARDLPKKETERRDSMRRNVVEMRSQWKGPGVVSANRGPLIMTLLGLSLLVSVVTQLGSARAGSFGYSVATRLLFCDPAAYAPGDDPYTTQGDPFASIKAGQVWRLVTPIFLHFGILHIVFNSFMIYRLGLLVEAFKGTVKVGLMILAMALLSNVAEAAFSSREHLVNFGGLSGVLYGLFGYRWMKGTFEPEENLGIDSTSVAILLGWFFLCWFGWIGNIANMAHTGGLLAGMFFGYAPVMLRGGR